jgi:hypothetical protein
MTMVSVPGDWAGSAQEVAKSARRAANAEYCLLKSNMLSEMCRG